MYILKTEQSFDSAHFLGGYEGKCRNIHGHRWRVVIEVKAEQLETEQPAPGHACGFADFKGRSGRGNGQTGSCIYHGKGNVKGKHRGGSAGRAVSSD